MKGLFVTLTMAISLCSEFSISQEVCSGENQSNYTRHATRRVTKLCNETVTTRQVIPDNCGFFEHIFNIFTSKCETKYREVARLEAVYRQTYEQYTVTECCPGFFHNGNSCIEGCEKGKYGGNCTLNCTCSNEELFCDKDTGDCLCPAGYTGENCTEECQDGFYGSNCTHVCACANNSTCDRRNGACNCTFPGWKGAVCSEECSNGTFGLYCAENCTCNGNQTCDHVTGSCTCKPGWTGINCSQECEAFAYGDGCQSCTCNNNFTEFCHHVTGQCHCRPGYIDGNCSQECPFGLYGDNCNGNCSKDCTGTDYCDHVSGTCICISSKGVNCSEECDDGWYGLNCNWSCQCNHGNNNGSCDNMGHCFCLDGWTGPKCEKGPDEQTATSKSLIEENFLYIAPPAAGVLLLVVVGVAILCCSWKRRRQRRDQKRGSLTGVTTSQDNPSYSSCDKENVSLPNGDSKTHLYEETVLEIDNKLELVSNYATNTNNCSADSDIANKKENYDQSYKSEKDDHGTPTMENNKTINSQNLTEISVSMDMEDDYNIAEEENLEHAYSRESKITSQCIEDAYNLPDKDTDEHIPDSNGVQEKEGSNCEPEEIYNSTEDRTNLGDIKNAYNTFQDVIKMQKTVNESVKKQVDKEEDYDVLERAGSHKNTLEETKHYSSFDEVRKLSLNDADEEETYDVIDGEQTKHKSASVIDSGYHHINLKDKTIDGSVFANNSNMPRSVSNDRKLQNQTKRVKISSINEESEDESENKPDERLEIRQNSKDGEITEEDITEVIYDECDLDDFNEEHTTKKGDTDSIQCATLENETKEVVYEECDLPEKENSRPPSGVLYEDVNDEVEDEVNVTGGAEGENLLENPDVAENKKKLQLKRTFERRREDYEEFSL